MELERQKEKEMYEKKRNEKRKKNWGEKKIEVKENKTEK